MSSAGTSDGVYVLVDSSTLTPDEIYIHEKNQKSQIKQSLNIFLLFPLLVSH